MAILDKDLKDVSSKQPQSSFEVVITTNKSLTELQVNEPNLPVSLEPIEGLEGFYKASLTGNQILSLENREDIESVSLDQPISAQQGE